MKKNILTLVVALCTLCASADSHYITFRQHDGAERSLPLVGLSISIEDGQLKASSQSESFCLDLTNMECMFFAPQATGIEQNITKAQTSSAKMVYDLQGRRVMTTDGQSKGIYIIQNGEGARKEIKR